MVMRRRVIQGYGLISVGAVVNLIHLILTTLTAYTQFCNRARQLSRLQLAANVALDTPSVHVLGWITR